MAEKKKSSKKAAKKASVNRSQLIRDHLANNPNDSPKEIVAALSAKNIKVTESLARYVKYSPQKKRGTKKTTTKRKRGKKAAKRRSSKKAAKKKARKAGVSLSQHIRNYIKKHPKDGAKTIVKGLAKNGIKVSESLASRIKYSPQEKKRRGDTRKRAKRAATGDTVRLSTLLEAKKTAKELGGVKKALDTVERAEKMAKQFGGLEKARVALAALSKLQ
jgi:arginine repressor